MKPVFLFLLFMGYTEIVSGQERDLIIARTIFIGDAGQVDRAQVQVIGSAAKQVLKGKTTVIFLGDNIYPNGMAIAGSPDTLVTGRILRSQFEPMRAKGARVYFLPGNHDWDRSGPHGLEKVRAAWKFIADQKDSAVVWLPANGCPDPQEIRLSDEVTVILFDSEWWLFSEKIKDGNSQCACNTSKDVLEVFKSILFRNKGKVILLAGHHPFLSYGNHGGHFTLMQHLFPLRELSRALYIPLPGIGSLIAFGRMLFPAAEDLKHPLYRKMIRQIDAVFANEKNLIHIAGHEHGLQFINSDGFFQVVSGSGAKLSHVVKGKYALYAEANPGYVVADQLDDKKIRFTYFKVTDRAVIRTFEFIKPYIR